MSRPLVVGNWKMNGSRQANRDLVAALLAGAAQVKTVDLVVCPPYPYLSQVYELLKGSHIALGGQNICTEAQGAYTGEVSAAMLMDVGCRCVIVGHSERRRIYAETDEVVATKFELAQKHKLLPILCVGETLEERESGVTRAVVERQLQAVLSKVGVSAFANAVVAYEPVWAIGTGKNATPEQAQAVHACIRELLASHDKSIAEHIQIVYGGSVTAENAAPLFTQKDIDGGLIGGASLKAEAFLGIVSAAASAI